MNTHTARRRVVLVLTAAAVAAAPGVAEAGYRLPWKYCLYQKVLQGWGGSTSHTGTMQYAYDFNHGEGTPVRVVESGTVKFTKSDVPASSCCSSSSCANNANYVTVYHGDGKATLYLHLKTVSVSVNGTVSRGQTIGTAGKTGWTGCTPHLHYQRQNQGGWFIQSISGYFDEYPNTQLAAGSSYKSQNFWPGDPCPQIAEVEAAEGVHALDAGDVDALASAGWTRAQAGSLGLTYAVPAGLDPVLYVPDQGDGGWPGHLPTWNLNFRRQVGGGVQTLDVQVEGYPGRHDVSALLADVEAAGGFEDVELAGARGTSPAWVFTWRNVAGRFLSAAKADAAGVVMVHARIDALADAAEHDGGGAALTRLADGVLLPALAQVSWPASTDR